MQRAENQRHAGSTREMSEALEELAWDIDRWILLLPSPRTNEARHDFRDWVQSLDWIV